MQAAVEQVVESLIRELRVEATGLAARFAAARRPGDRLGAVVPVGLLGDMGERRVDLSDL